MLVIIAPLIVLIVFLLLLVILAILMLAFDLILDLPYVATNRKKIGTIINFSGIKPGQTVVDLGSGDGRLLFAAAQKGARAIGYELNPLLVFLTIVHAKFKGQLKQIVVYRKNLWKADLAVADVIFVYSLKRDIKKFEDFIYQNAKAGTRIVVNTNPFPNKKPIKTVNGIYLYQV